MANTATLLSVRKNTLQKRFARTFGVKSKTNTRLRDGTEEGHGPSLTRESNLTAASEDGVDRADFFAVGMELDGIGDIEFDMELEGTSDIGFDSNIEGVNVAVPSGTDDAVDLQCHEDISYNDTANTHAGNPTERHHCPTQTPWDDVTEIEPTNADPAVENLRELLELTSSTWVGPVRPRESVRSAMHSLGAREIVDFMLLPTWHLKIWPKADKDFEDRSDPHLWYLAYIWSVKTILKIFMYEIDDENVRYCLLLSTEADAEAICIWYLL